MQAEIVLAPSYDIVPRGQFLHALMDEEPIPSAKVPDGHCVQLLFPVTFLKLPGTHGIHSWPFCPTYPALQTQSFSDVEPARENELFGHTLH